MLQHEEDLSIIEEVEKGNVRMGLVSQTVSKYDINVSLEGIDRWWRDGQQHLGDWNHVHSRLIEIHLSRSDSDQSVLVKLWTGSTMTRAKHAKMGEGDGVLDRGEPQDVYHLLWSCPLCEPPPIQIAYMRDLHSCRSVAHIRPQGADTRL